MSFSMLLASLLAATPTSSAAPPALTLTSPPSPATGLALAPADDGDDAYQVLASLCERELHELAVREGEAFLRDFPRHEKRHLARYRLADALFALERSGEAVAHYRKLVRLERFPYLAESWFRFGQCELEADELEKAGEALEQVLASDATYLHVPAMHLLGEVAFRAGDHAAARPRYEAVLAADAAGEYAPLARRGLAWGAWKLGDFDRSAEEARAFLDSYPESPLASEVRFVLGEAHLAAGRPAPALEAFRAIGEGEYADASLRGQGFAHAERGEYAAAAEAFGALVERHPQSRYLAEAALQRGVHLLRAGDAERAATALAHESIAADSEALAWRARALRELGRSAQALELVDRALAARAAQALEAELRVLRGDLLLDLGRGAEAARELERSGSDYALHAAAVAHLNEGRPDDAARLAEELLSRSPDGEYVPHARLVLGEARLARGEYSAADEALSALADARGAPAELVARGLSRLGWCRYLAGHPGAACAPLERLLARHPDAPEVEEARFLLGRARLEAGDGPGATAAMRDYLRAHPGGPHESEVLLALADLEGGTERLEALLDAHGDGALADEALFQLGERLSAQGDSAGAAARYRELLRRFPGSTRAPAARYGLAFALWEVADAEGAVRQLGALLEGDAPDELAIAGRELLVWAASASGELDAALDAALAIAAADVDDGRRLDVARAASRALVEGGRADDAQRLWMSVLDRVLERASAAAALVESAWIELDRGAAEQAEVRVRAALELSPADPAVCEAAFFAGEAFYGAGEDARAVPLYRAASAPEGSPVADTALYKEGFAHLRTGDAPAAEVAFRKVVDEHAASELWGESLFLLGEALFRQERWADAVAPLARLREERPKHESLPKALFRLGLAHAQLGQWKQAESALTQLVKTSADFEQRSEAELWRGRALASLGDARGARSAFDRVLELDQGVLAARARLEIGRLHLAARRTEDALGEFLKVAFLFAHDEEVAEALFLAGQCLEALDDREGAVKQYRECVDDHPETPFARRAKERLDALGA